jgi:hypothetical protein
MNQNQVVSKKRVSDHGEVYTNPQEVSAMLNLIQHETENINSRFLEPACGTGNFLVDILARKLKVVSSRYHRSQLAFERYAVLAVSSIYGIDLLLDNVMVCRERLFNVFNNEYTFHYKSKINVKCQNTVRFLLSKNILHGDALTLKTVCIEDSKSKPIIFSEWSALKGSMIKRRDFIYEHLVNKPDNNELPLFSNLEKKIYIPEPIKDFPLTHFLDLPNEN